MTKRFLREIERLKKQIIDVGNLVKANLKLAVQAVIRRDLALARYVIQRDDEIDAAEVDLEEECLKVLALHQPVAVDLRLIVAILKINNDLERIGDLATKIADRTYFLYKYPPLVKDFDLQAMAEKVQAMVDGSLQALVKLEPDLAYAVCQADDEIDVLNRRMHELVRAELCTEPTQAEGLIAMLGVTRNLERIADHATNIAEDVIYMIFGEIARHHRADVLIAQFHEAERKAAEPPESADSTSSKPDN
jgi:phosphate transport system protein